MKRVIIVHCWDGYPQYCWYPQVKKELEEKGFLVEVPAMPETNLPKLSLWLPKLKEVAGESSEDLYLIGHSAGCVTILRYLEDLDEGKKVGGVVLVAGFTDDLGFEELKNFFEDPIDFEKIKAKSDNFVLIHSDNDSYVDLKYGDLLKEKLNAKLIIKHNMGHFSGLVDNSKSVISLPDATEAIMDINKER